MKRLLWIFFAFYCLNISVLPCSDACDKHEHDVPMTMKQASNHHQDEQSECSPFCYCACCSTAAVVSTTIDYFFSETFSAGMNITILENVLPDMYFAIWQPPKAS